MQAIFVEYTQKLKPTRDPSRKLRTLGVGFRVTLCIVCRKFINEGSHRISLKVLKCAQNAFKTLIMRKPLIVVWMLSLIINDHIFHHKIFYCFVYIASPSSITLKQNSGSYRFFFFSRIIIILIINTQTKNTNRKKKEQYSPCFLTGILIFLFIYL